MIHNINEYVEYLESVRKRTMQYVKATPSFTLEWKPAENKFSTGDLLRHLGSSQLMFLSILEQKGWTYPGHERSKGETIEEITHYLEACHVKFIKGLLILGNDLLTKKIPTMHGHEVSSWRIMMAFIEHEIHHRGQLSSYLQNNNVEPPQIFGLKIEQVKRL
ncbi:DinB family protein [Cytobacillus dafuensis]|uniref:DinB family protein n=1 Tax=Cytobacillus dafuensis TaxID=1742359 RepID=A0A5B8Z8M5_CYTDA|nr:DinB family protein [Cytobacillus dafuensis]QED49314.1 DinB family protein [Cytobacillus dafuensis]